MWWTFGSFALEEGAGGNRVFYIIHWLLAGVLVPLFFSSGDWCWFHLVYSVVRQIRWGGRWRPLFVRVVIDSGIDSGPGGIHIWPSPRSALP